MIDLLKDTRGRNGRKVLEENNNNARLIAHVEERGDDCGCGGCAAITGCHHRPFRACFVSRRPLAFHVVGSDNAQTLRDTI